MGNNQAHIQSSVKEQTDNTAFKAYKYVDVTGGGLLIEQARKCQSESDWDRLDDAIRRELGTFVYNNGSGKRVHVSELVRFRTRQDAKEPGRRWAGRRRDNNVFPMLDRLESSDSSNHHRLDADFRDVAWDIEQRGAVGETCLHLCFLNATTTHMEVARRIIRLYPKVINDVYLSDIFYGESVLHIAISNEDPAMVKLLLENGCNVHQRCFGAFFCPEDQKDSRVSYLDDEFIDMRIDTNYKGHVYWGEYPLSFAACCGQIECTRLLLAKGADPNMADTNGNTVLHILVIHQPKMSLDVAKRFFVLLYNKGAKLSARNRQGLTPLTLAAKLGRKQMHTLVLMLERDARWRYGRTVSVAHPLAELDTISSDGSINKDSSLMFIVFGSELDHLEMLDGVVVRLLSRKWEAYGRKRFYQMFLAFTLYFAVFLVVFLLRPGTDRYPTSVSRNATHVNGSVYQVNVNLTDQCYLLATVTWDNYLRLAFECVLVVVALCSSMLVVRDWMSQGMRVHLLMLKATPMRCLYQISHILVLLMVPCRAACWYVGEDYLAVLSILCTTPYFLFFCRGFKLVGPFVLMVYRMVVGDLLRFCIIYVIFMLGFSQAMFIVFRRVEASIFHDPGEALMGMFIMSLGEFAEIYEQFDCSELSAVGKALFVVYMILVTLLLVNMLIAMMANTFVIVNQRQKEWLRQWARIVLVVEQTFTKSECQDHQLNYSQRLQDGSRALVVRWQSEDDDENKILLTRKRRVVSAEQRMIEDEELRKETEAALNRL